MIDVLLPALTPLLWFAAGIVLVGPWYARRIRVIRARMAQRRAGRDARRSIVNRGWRPIFVPPHDGRPVDMGRRSPNLLPRQQTASWLDEAEQWGNTWGNGGPN